jgi:CRP-like cAMP-binding protein
MTLVAQAMAKFRRSARALPVDCAACRTSSEGLCQSCAPAVREVLENYKSGDRVIKAGEDLFRQSESPGALYHLVDGWIFLYSLFGDGRRQILHFALPRAFLGLYPGTIAIYGAEALTDAKVCIIPQENIAALVEDHPGIGLRLASTVWRERNIAYDHLSSIGRSSARQRVARLLLELFVRYRMMWPASRAEEMQLPLTQEHIGDATGLTGIHVNRVLRNLGREKIVQFHYRRLRILNPDKLVDVAGVDPHAILSWTGRHPPPRS